MKPGIHNFSEIGKLNKVLLHRLGDEVEGLVPDNFERLLFDDIPYLKVAQQEHDRFAQLLRDNGVEVVYYLDETAKALEKPGVKSKFIKEFLDASHIYSQGVYEELSEYLENMSAYDVVSKAIAGIKKGEIADIKHKSLADYISVSYPYYTDPMPNLYFTRDPGACIGNGINIHHMSTQARRREPLLLKYMYMYNDDFTTDREHIWYDYNDEFSIEGGDVLVLSKDTVAIGLSQRTTVSGIERFSKNLLSGSDFKKIIVFDIPKCRAFMHLDTVFTMVDYDKFTIHHEIEDPLHLFEISLDRQGEVKVRSVTDSLTNLLKLELSLPAVELIRCGGEDLMAAQREQWNDGSNTLCIAPGKVVTYERNYVTNDILDKKGLTVLTVPSAELSRGRGGPRCMSCPVNRDDL